VGHDEFTWDDPVRSYAETWQRVVFTPREFFALDRSGRGLQAPIGFLLVSLALGGFGLVVAGWGPTALPLLLVGGLFRVLLTALFVWIVASRIFSGIGDYEATLRVLAYSSAVSVLIFVPGVRLIAVLYGLYLVIVGLERAHHFDAVQAVLTLIVTAIAVAVLAFALTGMSVFSPVHPAWLRH
jgi:hypothetical protein